MKTPIRPRRHFNWPFRRNVDRRPSGDSNVRKLDFAVDSLEERCMLAGVAVTNATDLVNATNLSTISALVANDGGDGVSLREAIEAANNQRGRDTITFDSSLSGATIQLAGSQLEITEYLDLDASSLAANVTIDAQQNSRAILISSTSDEFTIHSVNVMNGVANATPQGNLGGGILFLSTDTLNIIDSTISGNQSGSSSSGAVGRGAGIWADGSVTLTNSTVHNNTAHFYGVGGGISSEIGDVTITSSTISNNHSNKGGGIFTVEGQVTVKDSTISGNRTSRSSGRGGGINSAGAVFVENSTITDNYTSATSSGGGIATASNLTVTNSIIAGNNTAFNTNPDLLVGGAINARFSLIGNNKDTTLVESQTADSNGNLIGGTVGGVIDAMLDGLSDNGGPTQTHALLAGSLARNAGDPASSSNVDQRQSARVSAGRIDMGAYELQTAELVNGILSVNGSNGRDNVTVRATGGQIRVQSKLNLGSPQRTSEVHVFDTATVQSVSIRLHGENDVARISRNLTVGTLIDGGAGNDRLTGGDASNTLLGGDGNDRLRGGNANDIIIGGAGDDRLLGRGGSDILSGMEGNDVLTGGAGDTPDFLIGGSGRDRLSGGAGSDLLIGHQVGGESDATILGTSLNQWIASPTGIPANLNFFTPDNVQDQLIGGSGNDLLEGEPGDVFRQ